jgi:F-type H+-transporting ATPase subunit gamma
LTSRRQVEAHRRSLAEIRNIMNAMKNLAYMETRKLERCLSAQNAVLSTIEDAAADFVTAYPQALPDSVTVNRAYLLVGSERGFCGDFNEALLDQPVFRQPGAASAEPPMLIVTGRKLQALLANDARVVALLDGANVVEEVAPVLTRVVEMLAQLQTRYGVLSLQALYHAGGRQEIVTQPILPPFQRYRQQPERFSLSPLLNLDPAEFLIGLSDHYLFAALHQIFYASLMAENERRVQHLNAAVDHLDEKSLDLQRRANALRQEEIIEEIEVILLSGAENEPSMLQQDARDLPQRS